MNLSWKLLRAMILPLVIILAMLLNGCMTGRNGKDSFYFIQMSDPQFGFYNDNKSFELETAHYLKAIAEANRLRPAFVVVTGDLVNKPFDTAQIHEYKRISGKLNPRIPLYSVPGNHDVGNTPYPKDIDLYNDQLGKDYYSFTSNTMLGIVLNSLYLKDPQHIPAQAAQQEKWLVETLEEAKRKRYRHIIVFLHHPMFLNQPDEDDQYFNIPKETRKKYMDIFRAAGIKYIFAGHYHRNAFAKDQDIEMVTTGPVGKPLGKDSSGFRIIRVLGNQISHQYYTLDSIPARVQL